MRFLANENFPGAAVAALVAAGHDVVWIRTTAPGSTDREVLAQPLTMNAFFSRSTRISVNLPRRLRCRQRAV
jgi:Domain of unknown function (DUF5615)